MVEKIRSNCFGCYFYKNYVSDASLAKHIVWTAKNAIFSTICDSSPFFVSDEPAATAPVASTKPDEVKNPDPEHE